MSGGGGGIIIIKQSIVSAVGDPLVHGNLPQHMQDTFDALVTKGTDNWGQDDYQTAVAIFIWAAMHC